MYAAEVGNTPAVKVLLVCQSAVEATSDEGKTALFIAAENEHTASIKALVRFNNDLLDVVADTEALTGKEQ